MPTNEELHPLISLFESKAEVLDLADSKDGIDEAITLMAGWMETAADKLSEDDLAILSDVGAILYRAGLVLRM